jgi:hypothetical protein
MKKFLVLYRSSASNQEQMAKTTPEQRKSMMDAWGVWMKKAGPALLDVGAPIGSSSLLRGTPAPGHVGGYSIVQAESIDAARSLFDGHPHFAAPNASIELLEVMSMPGM